MVWSGSASYDVAIVGAGPCGSATALAFASRGAKVLLIEGNPKASSRLAGEWIHPPGVARLREFGVDLQEHDAWAGRGFVLHWAAAGEPVLLPYPSELGLSCDHERLVGALRSRALDQPDIEYLPMARVRSLTDDSLTVEDRRSAKEHVVRAGRIVGADGRSSVVRRSLGLPADSAALSHMAAVDLRGAQLPFEGWGHVLLGGPGPMLLYRVEIDRIRLCLDVPLSEESSLRHPQSLWEAFSHHLPKSLHASFRQALSTRPIRWAANAFRPRTTFGRGSILLAGDALGHTHPCTAIGLTQALNDAWAVAECKTVREYQRQRTSQTAELLSNVLYHVFRRGDASALELRYALFDVLRDSEEERRRTIAILSTEDDSRLSFSLAFLKAASRGFARAVRTPQAPVGERVKQIAACGQWLKWPAAAVSGLRLPGVAPKAEPVVSGGNGVERALPDGAGSPEGDPEGGARPGEVRAGAPAGDEPRVAATGSSLSSPSEPPRPSARGLSENGTADDFAFCEQSLMEVSRSFAEPIGLLPTDLRRALCVGYLLCRVVDTVEDHAAIALSKRDELFASFLNVLNGVAPGTELERKFGDVEGDDPELRLARSTSRVLGVFAAQSEPTREATRSWVSEMTHGMRLYAHRPAGPDGVVALNSVPDLERYCYFAAGTVGLMITDLFVEHLRRSGEDGRAAGLRTYAESFGVGLQLVNILEDVTHDLERRWCYVPRSILREHGLGPLDLLETPKRARAHLAVAPLFQRADYHLDSALKYALSLPPKERELRLFCLLPLWMAAATLRIARGNDDMFVPGRPVKIGRTEAGEMASFCMRFCSDDAALRRGYERIKNGEPRESRILA